MSRKSVSRNNLQKGKIYVYNYPGDGYFLIGECLESGTTRAKALKISDTGLCLNIGSRTFNLSSNYEEADSNQIRWFQNHNNSSKVPKYLNHNIVEQQYAIY